MQPTTDNRQPTTDLLILGGGPGGIAALLWAHSVGLKATLLESSSELGGQLLQMFHPVVDYPGLLPADGAALRDQFKQHLDALSLSYRLGCRIESVDLANKAVVCVVNFATTGATWNQAGIFLVGGFNDAVTAPAVSTLGVATLSVTNTSKVKTVSTVSAISCYATGAPLTSVKCENRSGQTVNAVITVDMNRSQEN